MPQFLMLISNIISQLKVFYNLKVFGDLLFSCAFRIFRIIGWKGWFWGVIL